MNFEPQALLLWGNLFLSLAAVAGHVKNWMSSGEKQLTTEVAKLSAKIEGFEKKLTEHDRRIQTVEGEMKHLPDRESQHRMEMMIEKIAGRLDTMDERMKPVAATYFRLQEYVMENSKK